VNFYDRGAEIDPVLVVILTNGQGYRVTCPYDTPATIKLSLAKFSRPWARTCRCPISKEADAYGHTVKGSKTGIDHLSALSRRIIAPHDMVEGLRHQQGLRLIRTGHAQQSTVGGLSKIELLSDTVRATW